MADIPIKIGAVLPFSGGEELSGPQCIQGARMAIEEINAHGGVLGGRKFELIIEDSKTDAETAYEKARKLILEDKVTAILGPVISSARDLITPMITEYKVPLLYGTDYEGGACNRYLFCYSAIPEHYVKPFVPYLIENYGNTFFLLGSNYVWPIKTNEYIKSEVPKLGGKVVGEEYFPFEVREFGPTIQKILNSGANIVISVLIFSDAIAFLKQLSDQGLNKSIKTVGMAFNESTLPNVPKEQVEGVLTCNHFFESLDRPEAKDFVDRQRKMFGQDTVVTYYAVSHYGLVMFFKNAIQRAQSDETEKIIDAMGDQSMVVGNGEVKLRSWDHHMVLNIVIAEVNNGKLVQKKYIGPIDPADQCSGKEGRF
jgi:ABC-type branched-subunit amino acid transport system substrate-binding protein